MRQIDRILKLGTRDSLLAKAQSQIVAHALTMKNPGLRIELVPVTTRGDLNRKIPLSRVRDPDFFSAELDTALAESEVDFCVHSLKDLDTRRPEGIVRAAIPARENPRDVVVFRRSIIESLRGGHAIRIGSSSERRQINASQFLREALPRLGNEPELKFSPLRGPVDQRLTRIRKAADDPDALDGVILAIAGLSRLWNEPAGRRTVEPLLAGVRWMVLPLSRCPAAPGQGALAVECRKTDEQTRTVLSTIHDPNTAALVQAELDTLAAAPEFARASLGATAVSQERLGTLMYLRNGNTGHERVTWQGPPRPADARAWDGGQLEQYLRRRPLPLESPLTAFTAVFVAHWRAMIDARSLPLDTRIWTSGVGSWRQLARQGLWVEGCADNLGFAAILPTLKCKILGLPALEQWLVLTHKMAKSSWRETGVGHVHSTYEIEPVDNLDRAIDLHREINQATHFFWGSFDQYRRVKKWVPDDAHHACGSGKTAQALRKTGLTAVDAFPSRKEWRAWLR